MQLVNSHILPPHVRRYFVPYSEARRDHLISDLAENPEWFEVQAEDGTTERPIGFVLYYFAEGEPPHWIEVWDDTDPARDQYGTRDGAIDVVYFFPTLHEAEGKLRELVAELKPEALRDPADTYTLPEDCKQALQRAGLGPELIDL